MASDVLQEWYLNMQYLQSKANAHRSVWLYQLIFPVNNELFQCLHFRAPTQEPQPIPEFPVDLDQ